MEKQGRVQTTQMFLLWPQRIIICWAAYIVHRPKRFIVDVRSTVLIANVGKLCRLSVWLFKPLPFVYNLISVFVYILNFVGSIDKHILPHSYDAVYTDNRFFFYLALSQYIRKTKNGFSFTCCSWISWKKLGYQTGCWLFMGKDVNTTKLMTSTA